MNRKNKMLLWCVALFGAIALVGCSDSDTAGTPDGPNPTPKGEFSLSTFSPNYGKYLQKVVFEGSGFTSPENMKVYFNQRPSAVIGVSPDGTKFYALAPRLPGDDCVISVVQGEDSLVYNDTFAYTASTTVETLVGSGKAGQTMGPFSEAEISPYYVVADASGNLFCASRNQADAPNAGTNDHSFIRIDMVNQEVSMLSKGSIPNVPTCDQTTGVVSVPTESYIGSFIEFNPIEMWAPRFRQFTWDPNNNNVPSQPWKHCMVVNPTDGRLYTRFYHGHIVAIDPVTYESEFIYKTGEFNTYGMCFRASEPNVMYFTNHGGHRIYKLDMNLPAEQREAIQINGGTGTAGHRDGDLDQSLFNNPSMIYQDSQDNIYVADEGNHCIRRITPENQVETVLGIPGKSGWQDGAKESALFYKPKGICIDKDDNIYVADYGNSRVRKLSIN